MSERIDWKYLMDKFTSNTCSREEFERLLALIESEEDPEGLTVEMRRQWDAAEIGKGISPQWKERFSKLLAESPGQHPEAGKERKVRRLMPRKWVAVAAVAATMVIGLLMWYRNTQPSQNIAALTITKQNKNVTPAGRNKALLILADGTSISLDSANNGTIATQGGVKIIKGEEGEILYYPDRQKTIATGFNTIVTPRGGKYSVVLSDGTKVWLNAASTIQFPAEFTGATRDVSLNGEAYFEVAKNVSKPFRVKTGKLDIEVLGTEFNVNAYPEEGHVSTTLVQGAVKVGRSADVNTSRTVLLKPGEQASLGADYEKLTVDHSPNMEQVLAWKNGKFEFANTPVPVIMREISRWYDVDIVFRGALPGKRLTGTFSRNVNIDRLVEMLRYAGVNITIEGKKLLILPN